MCGHGRSDQGRCNFLPGNVAFRNAAKALRSDYRQAAASCDEIRRASIVAELLGKFTFRKGDCCVDSEVAQKKIVNFLTYAQAPKPQPAVVRLDKLRKIPKPPPVNNMAAQTDTTSMETAAPSESSRLTTRNSPSKTVVVFGNSNYNRRPGNVAFRKAAMAVLSDYRQATVSCDGARCDSIVNELMRQFSFRKEDYWLSSDVARKRIAHILSHTKAPPSQCSASIQSPPPDNVVTFGGYNYYINWPGNVAFRKAALAVLADYHQAVVSSDHARRASIVNELLEQFSFRNPANEPLSYEAAQLKILTYFRNNARKVSKSTKTLKAPPMAGKTNRTSMITIQSSSQRQSEMKPRASRRLPIHFDRSMSRDQSTVDYIPVLGGTQESASHTDDDDLSDTPVVVIRNHKKPARNHLSPNRSTPAEGPPHPKHTAVSANDIVSRDGANDKASYSSTETHCAQASLGVDGKTRAPCDETASWAEPDDIDCEYFDV